MDTNNAKQASLDNQRAYNWLQRIFDDKELRPVGEGENPAGEWMYSQWSLWNDDTRSVRQMRSDI